MKEKFNASLQGNGKRYTLNNKLFSSSPDFLFNFNESNASIQFLNYFL